jgi:hypothetical protein
MAVAAWPAGAICNLRSMMRATIRPLRPENRIVAVAPYDRIRIYEGEREREYQSADGSWMDGPKLVTGTGGAAALTVRIDHDHHLADRDHLPIPSTRRRDGDRYSHRR